ncbi:hypothetical protein A5635_26850 [Mycobacterium asiaticum]|uniref:Glycosyltransferase 2-like domain-containing protein n=2 Tax=Mycobacterium asiaticum TaxID=1790 RepID=A0A1A3NBS1_MYCAS|nr:hypothetical protein A5635_26850 [Mycobacterium asiaticum]
MPDPVTERPAICLNMIVRNEAHIVHEVLDAVAHYISYWVVVDTGSEDGTQDLIRDHMANLGIPGELHERPWLNFGHNRTEALNLAQGHGDYIWVIDADDTVVGDLDLTELGAADIYWLRHGGGDDIYWRPQLFRDGFPVRYEGVVHEHAAWDYGSCVDVRIEGDYHIASRRLGARNLDPQKYARDRDILLAEIERDPDNPRSVFYLAQSYFDLGDFANARTWYARRAEMGDWDEEMYFALCRVAESMVQLGEPWPDVQDAYLRAWEFRPTRAEPLYSIARHYREAQRYQLGYQFARAAAEIPFPEADRLFVRADIYAWRAADEQGVCASWIGRQPEAFTLFRRMLARPELSDDDRQRCAGNRDVCVATMIEAMSVSPAEQVETLTRPLADSGQSDVTVSLIAGPELEPTEQTLNSFLHCCTDFNRIDRFVLLDTGLSIADRAQLRDNYPFLEFIDAHSDDRLGAHLAQIRAHIDERFWLHLSQGWRFFAPDTLLTRLIAVLDAEPDVFQVAINFTDATNLVSACAPEHVVRRTPDAGRYLLTNTTAQGPAMFDINRLDRLGDFSDTDPDPLIHLSHRATSVGLHAATLDEVLSISGEDSFQNRPWATSAADIVNELLALGRGRYFAELNTDAPGPILVAVAAGSKISETYELGKEFLVSDRPEGGYDVIFVDLRREPRHHVEVIERCLRKLSFDGALVVNGSCPPGDWRQRVLEEPEAGTGPTSGVRQAVIEFRLLHPQCEVITVEAGWGCTVIRPSYQAPKQSDPESVLPLSGTAYERERKLLNLVDFATFRRHIEADALEAHV